MNHDQEQRNALLALMGTVYGEAKKLDQNLVGSSTNLQPTSNNVKTMFESALRGSSPQPSAPLQQHLPESVNLPYIVQPVQESKPVQLIDNSDLVVILKGIESNLGKLVEIFTTYDIKVQKKSNRKVSKLDIKDKRPVHPESGKGTGVDNSDINRQHSNSVLNSKPFE